MAEGRDEKGWFVEGAPCGPGRPTLYRPEFADRARELMQNGYSLTGVAGKLGVTKSTVKNWVEAHPEFAEAVEIGKAARTAAYEEHAWNIARGHGGPGAGGMVQFMLKNFAPDEYQDAQTLRHAGHDGGAMRPPTFQVMFGRSDGEGGDQD